MPFDATPIKTNTVADVLRRARALIDSPEKWGKGNGLSDPERGHCVITAIYEVPWHERRSADLWFARANNIDHIARWNDAPERTHAEVMAAFDRAIELAEAGG